MFNKRCMAAVGLSLALVFAPISGAAFADPQPSVDDARVAMQSYGDELAAFENELANASTILEETKQEIDETQKKVDDAKVRYTKVRDQLSARMRADYRGGAFSILDILLGASSIEDFVSRVYYLSRMNTQDTELMIEAEQLKDELIGHLAELEERKASCEEIIDNSDAKVQELTDKLQEAQSYFNSLSADVQSVLSDEVAHMIESDNVETNDSGVVTNGLVSAVANVQVANYQESVASGEAAASEASNSVVTAISNTTGNGYSSGLSNAVDKAYSVIGTQYTWGGTTVETGFDCSGLVNYAYGGNRGRTTYQMIDSLQSTGDWKTNIDDLEYGDLVFPSEGHVGIYIGDGQMVHAPKPGESVTVSTVYNFIGGGSY